jgi:nucleotide-binding universal stress UspA family protein
MTKPLFRNVLVAINGSESSINATQYGILMAKQFGCSLKAVYVVDTATLKKLTMSKLFVTEEFADYETSLTEDGKRYLGYVAELGKQKKIKLETDLRKGAVWTEIITAAVESQADLILLGGYSSDHAAVKRALPEHHSIEFSNGEIIANAPCSVLVVREKSIEQLFKIS